MQQDSKSAYLEQLVESLEGHASVALSLVGVSLFLKEPETLHVSQIDHR